MRLLIVGAGATGGYIGAGLAAVGCDVTFLLRPGQAATSARCCESRTTRTTISSSS
ncbi:MAG: hypothetical protein C0447_13870 [Methylobacterium sp.]|nr:hypothetical protein [Methylobacterium sp.]